MPVRVKTAVGCLAIALASCASPTTASADNSPADSGPVAGAGAPAASGRTVRTELEYLTSRQSVDPRKASKADAGVGGAASEPAASPTPAKAAPVERAARFTRRPQAAAPVDASVEVSGRAMSDSLSVADNSVRAGNRSRRHAHKASNWSLSFMFRGLRDAIVSGRVQYLPLLGAAPVRFKNTEEFDRTKIVGLRQFDERMDEVSIKTKPEDDAAEKTAGASPGSRAVASDVVSGGASPEGVAGAKPSSASIVADAANAANGGATTKSGASGTVTSVRSDPKIVTTESAAAQGSDYIPVSSEMVMKYFDKRKEGPEVKVGMPFVMPYQSEQPLIMDSRATYSQTEGGTQNGTSAK
jgi:hypothetical protein